MSNNNEQLTKVPCGGFQIGSGLALSEDGKTLNVSGGRCSKRLESKR